MFSIKIKITDKDINRGNHVGNERALIFFQEVRKNFLLNFGLSHMDIGMGIGLIQKESYINYNNQIFFNEIINVKISNITFKRIKMKVEYEITSEDGNTLITGYTIMAPFNYELQKVCKYPPLFLEKINLFINNK